LQRASLRRERRAMGCTYIFYTPLFQSNSELTLENLQVYEWTMKALKAGTA
jgi:hypothetical protein